MATKQAVFLGIIAKELRDRQDSNFYFPSSSLVLSPKPTSQPSTSNKHNLYFPNMALISLLHPTRRRTQWKVGFRQRPNWEWVKTDVVEKRFELMI